jgi:hypothetical protein
VRWLANAYADCDGNSNCYRNGNSNSNCYRNGNSNGDSHRHRYRDDNTAAIPDADEYDQTSADAKAASHAVAAPDAVNIIAALI